MCAHLWQPLGSNMQLLSVIVLLFAVSVVAVAQNGVGTSTTPKSQGFGGWGRILRNRGHGWNRGYPRWLYPPHQFRNGRNFGLFADATTPSTETTTQQTQQFQDFIAGNIGLRNSQRGRNPFFPFVNNGFEDTYGRPHHGGSIESDFPTETSTTNGVQGAPLDHFCPFGGKK